MIKVLTKTKLPPVINKVVVIIGLCGMFIGLLIGIHNEDTFPVSLLFGAGFGFLFAACSKYLVVKFMRAWMEGKLEQVAREREDARLRAEQTKTAEDDAARHQP